MSRKKRRKQENRREPVSVNDATEATWEETAGDNRGMLRDLEDGDVALGQRDVSEPFPAPSSDSEPEPAVPSEKPGILAVISQLLTKAYELVVFTVGIGLCVSMVVATYGGGSTIQWVFGIMATLTAFLSRTVFANDLSDIYQEAKEKVEEDRRRDEEELSSGNYDGVPKAIQEVLRYPTKEDYEQIRAEAERQRELLRKFGIKKSDEGDNGSHK